MTKVTITKRTQWLRHLYSSLFANQHPCLRSMSIVIVLGCSKDYNFAYEYPKHSWNMLEDRNTVYPLSITLHSNKQRLAVFCAWLRGTSLYPENPRPRVSCLNIIHFHSFYLCLTWDELSSMPGLEYYFGKIALEFSRPEGSWKMLLGVDVSVKPWVRSKIPSCALAKRSERNARFEHKKYAFWASFLKCRVSKARNEVLTTWQKNQLLSSMSC